MRGGFLHNIVLVDSLHKALSEQGARVYREYQVAPGRRSGFIDLVAVRGSEWIAIEAELTPDRIGWDMEKADAIGASLLLVVMPHGRAVSRARKSLAEGARVRTRILDLGHALEAVRNNVLFSGTSEVQKSSGLYKVP